jgi:hypothetical protein
MGRGVGEDAEAALEAFDGVEQDRRPVGRPAATSVMPPSS